MSKEEDEVVGFLVLPADKVLLGRWESKIESREVFILSMKDLIDSIKHPSCMISL